MVHWLIPHGQATIGGSLQGRAYVSNHGPNVINCHVRLPLSIAATQAFEVSNASEDREAFLEAHDPVPSVERRLAHAQSARNTRWRCARPARIRAATSVETRQPAARYAATRWCHAPRAAAEARERDRDERIAAARAAVAVLGAEQLGEPRLLDAHHHVVRDVRVQHRADRDPDSRAPRARRGIAPRMRARRARRRWTRGAAKRSASHAKHGIVTPLGAGEQPDVQEQIARHPEVRRRIAERERGDRTS